MKKKSILFHWSNERHFSDGFDFSLIKSDGIFKIEVVKNQYFSIHDNLRKKNKINNS